jgi:hypothetical protein
MLSATVAYAGELPDSTLTPGDADARLSAVEICARAFSTFVTRDVSAAIKREVYRRYGMSQDSPPCPCEVDHLIPLALGGSTSIENLWPEPRDGEWGSLRKDALERRLHSMVCRSELSLEAAQDSIAIDWIEALKRHLRP